MLPADTVSLFVAASLALAIAPGPDNIFVLTQSAVHGRRTGLLIALGLCTGLIVHISAVALGVAAIFMTSVLAFTVMKFLGAAYLLYLAWKSFRAGSSALPVQDGSRQSDRALYTRGIVMNVTNPKVAIFFLAFLPQFTSSARGSVPMQIVLLGLIFMASALLVFGLIAWAAGQIGGWLKRSERAQVIINRVAGTVFVALAGKLAFTHQ